MSLDGTKMNANEESSSMSTRTLVLALCAFLHVFPVTLTDMIFGRENGRETGEQENTRLTDDARNAGFRTWTSGNFTVEARLVESTKDTVRLEKRDGASVSVAIRILSDADQRFIASQAVGGRSGRAKEDNGQSIGVGRGHETPCKTKAELAAIRRANEMAKLRQDLAKELSNRPDGYVVLALEEYGLANGRVSIAIAVSKGREAVAHDLTQFWFNGNPTRRSFQILAWYDNSARSKQLAGAHQRKLQGFINNRMQDPIFSLEPCYSDLRSNVRQTLAQRIAEGTAIRYVPFATARHY